ncbi:MAG: ABC transporter ATP-binding protein [Candidatus Dojkabacteria bacterium]|nr:ABC transporter ATP-binding protein [Candidatus Dojkabacteria bacterium]
MQQVSPFRILKKYITQKEYLVLLIASFASMIALSLLSLTIPKITSTVINEFQSNYSIPTSFYAIIAVLLLVTAGFFMLQSYFFGVLGEKIAKDLRNRLMTKVLNQDYNYLVKEKSSKILTVVLNDVNNVKLSFIQIFTLVISSTVLIIGSIFLMFSINGKIATYIVLTIPAVIGILFLLLRKKFGIFKKIQKVRDSLNKVINENIKASMLIRVFVSEKTELKKFEKRNRDTKRVGIDISKLFAIAIPAVNAISLISMLIIIQIGGSEVIKGNIQIGDISAFNLYVLIFTMPLLAISFMSTLFGQSIASLRRIGDVLYKPNEFIDGKEPLGKISNVLVKKLSFVDEGAAILKDIDFEIRNGQKIGIMGLTGSGKSIFLRHLIRAIENTDGDIFINNENIKKYKVKDIRKNIGFCFQDNFLVNDSIYENIRFGRDIPEKEIMKVAKLADVDEFAKESENGYQTKVGERGSSISGGQKQRIMIARALAGKPSLLIFDDITSRLDANTEKKIFDNIKREYKDISMILVSQKVSSFIDCDMIYIFDEGEIKEKGTHKELLEKSPLYKEIELAQSNYDER